MFLLYWDVDSLTESTTVEQIARRYLDRCFGLRPIRPSSSAAIWGLAAWHLAYLLRSRGVVVLELVRIETLSLNARPLLRGLRRLFDTAGSILPGRAGRFLRQHAMRAVWWWLRGQATFGALLYRSARNKMIFREKALESSPPRPFHFSLRAPNIDGVLEGRSTEPVGAMAAMAACMSPSRSCLLHIADLRSTPLR